jgi:SRSO17 transposase
MGTDAATVEGWGADFDGLMERAGPCFARRDLRARAGGYLRGLLGRVDRKNGWQVAEYLVDTTPYGSSGCSAAPAGTPTRPGTRSGGTRPTTCWPRARAGVLVVDETGFLKGDKSVGVQRQCSGTAGGIENCQVGVFLALSGSRGRALVDRELYLPESWSGDSARRRAAGVPDDVRFATKPALGLRRLDRAFAAGLRPAWVLADEVYGSDGKFRRHLEGRGQPYVVAGRADERVWVGFDQRRVDAVAGELPADAWHRVSVGDGAKGPRVYDWAAGRLHGQRRPHGLARRVLVRRSLADPADRAYYLCLAPAAAAGADLAADAGRRWSVECCFETAKQEAGLDEHEVRSWAGWHRHVTLSMLALAFLAAVRARAADAGAGGKAGGPRLRRPTWSR